MKFTIKFYDLDDPKLDDDTLPLWEERCWVTLSRTILTIERSTNRFYVYISSMEIDSDNWQPNNCFIVWGFTDMNMVWHHVKVEMYSSSRNIKTN